MKLNWKTQNLHGLELEVKTGLNNLFTGLFKKVEAETIKFGNKLVENIAKSREYQELMTDPILRAQLGMPKSSFKLGGDTDGPDLLAKLSGFKIHSNIQARIKEVRLVFPTMTELADGLQRHLSRIKKNSLDAGIVQSWFEWWEFGNAREAEGLTVTLRNASKLKTNKSARSINDIITSLSRSGTGIQIPSATSATVINARGLIRKTYANYGKVFPAFISKVVRRFATSNKNTAGRFFARGFTQ